MLEHRPHPCPWDRRGDRGARRAPAKPGTSPRRPSTRGQRRHRPPRNRPDNEGRRLRVGDAGACAARRRGHPAPRGVRPRCRRGPPGSAAGVGGGGNDRWPDWWPPGTPNPRGVHAAGTSEGQLGPAPPVPRLRRRTGLPKCGRQPDRRGDRGRQKPARRTEARSSSSPRPPSSLHRSASLRTSSRGQPGARCATSSITVHDRGPQKVVTGSLEQGRHKIRTDGPARRYAAHGLVRALCAAGRRAENRGSLRRYRLVAPSRREPIRLEDAIRHKGVTREDDEDRPADGLLGCGAAAQRSGARDGSRPPRLRLGLDGGVLRFRRTDTLGLVGLADRAGASRHLAVPALGAHPDRDGHGGPDPGPPLGRALRARPRGLGAPGGRGLVRPVLPRSPGPHPRVRRNRAPGPRPREAGDQRRTALPAPVSRRHRSGQAPQVDRAPAAGRHPDHSRSGGPEEHRPGGGDRRRLVPHLLLPARHVLLRGVARRGLRPARVRDAARRTSRCWPSRPP